MQKRHWKWRKTMRQRVVPQIRCVRIFGCSLHRSLFISRMSIHPMGIWFKPSVLIYLRKFEFYYWGESAGRRGPSESDSYWTPLLILGHEAGSLKDELTSDLKRVWFFPCCSQLRFKNAGLTKVPRALHACSFKLPTEHWKNNGNHMLHLSIFWFYLRFHGLIWNYILNLISGFGLLWCADSEWPTDDLDGILRSYFLATWHSTWFFFVHYSLEISFDCY